MCVCVYVGGGGGRVGINIEMLLKTEVPRDQSMDKKLFLLPSSNLCYVCMKLPYLLTNSSTLPS